MQTNNNQGIVITRTRKALMIIDAAHSSMPHGVIGNTLVFGTSFLGSSPGGAA